MGGEEMKFYVDIIETETEKREKRMGPFHESLAKKFERSANENLNHERYHTDLVPETEVEEN